MTRKLLVVAASGLVLAILLLSAAWAIGGQAMLSAMHHGGWHFTDGRYILNGDDDDHGPRTTRSLAFDPAVPLTLDAPFDLHFTRGDHPGMTVSGPTDLVNAVRWENGRLSLSATPMWTHGSLDVAIVAPTLPPLTLAGAGDVSLDNLAQAVLRIDLSGAGNIDASGKVKNVSVTSSGAGNVDLEHLDATDATVDASGMGNLDLNASGKVNVTMSGAGNLSLHRRPAELTSHLSGVGSIDQDY